MTKFKKAKLSLDDRIENSKFSYTKNLKWFLIAPVVIIFVGLIMFCTLGFNLGIDFTGGTFMKVYIDSEGAYTEQAYDIDRDFNTIENKIRSVVSKYDAATLAAVQKTTMNGDKIAISNGDAVEIKFQVKSSLTSEEITDLNNHIRYDLLVEFGFVDADTDAGSFENYTELENAELVQNNETTSPSASAELLMNSFIALIVAVALILIYIAIRFEFTSGLAAILALFHDLLITTAVVIICRIQINAAFIAALITILGYSINNTIIIFDRMRDHLKVLKQSGEKIDNNQVANASVKETMMRSILTMVTTFVMIFMITVIGVADIRAFAFPIMVGILAGFYSSVFLTPGLWAIAYKPRKRSTKVAKPTQKKAVKE